MATPKAFATHELKKMTALFVRYCKDHTGSCMRPKMMITGASFENNGVKEWVAIVVTNYGREPNVKKRWRGAGELCTFRIKMVPLLHKERFPIPVSWSHGPKCPAVRGRDTKIFISVQSRSALLAHAHRTMFYILLVLLLGTQHASVLSLH